MSSITYLFILISFITTAKANDLRFDTLTQTDTQTYETDLPLLNSRHLLSTTPFDSAWTNGGTMGSRTCTRMVPFYYNNKIFLLGSTYNLNGLYEYDISTKQFTDKGTNILSEDIRRWSQSYTQIGNLGYAIGDYGSGAGASLYVYTLTTNGPSLSKTITIPIDQKGNKACLTSTTSQLFVIGGVDPAGGTYDRTDRLQIYNLPNGPWETNPPFMILARDSFPCVVVNDYLYAIGGYSYFYYQTQSRQIEKIERIQITNILNNEWNETSYNLIQTLEENSAVVIDQYIVLIGGWILGTGTVPSNHGVQIIDTEQNTIKYGGALVRGLYGMGVINIDNIIYGFGGFADAQEKQNTWQYLTLASITPTSDPTISPTQTTYAPSGSPTRKPTTDPTSAPSKNPTVAPTRKPTSDPSMSPTQSTFAPSGSPTIEPTINPTTAPTPTDFQTTAPTGTTSKTSTKDEDILDDGGTNILSIFGAVTITIIIKSFM